MFIDVEITDVATDLEYGQIYFLMESHGARYNTMQRVMSVVSVTEKIVEGGVERLGIFRVTVDRAGGERFIIEVTNLS